MCYASVNGHGDASIIGRVIDWLTVASAVLIILIVTGCAGMTPAQQEAAWRIAARNVTVLATAFSPEARVVLVSCCAMRDSTSKELLQRVWSDLSDLQANAVVQSINDVVTLAKEGLGDQFKDEEQMFASILDAICSSVVVSQ